jgi:multisubunit Na+/H+ antiporter MnhG subunit
MILEEIRNIKSNRREWRKFGLVVGVVFGLIGLLLLWRHRDYYVYFLALSAALICPALVYPPLLNPVHKAWMTGALLIGWVMTRVILIMVFYLAVTPIALLARVFRRRFLHLDLDRGAKSYWIVKETHDRQKERYEQQF